MTRHEPRAALAAGRMEQVLEQAELVVAADERRLEGLAPVAAADLGDDPQRAPGRHRRRLALEGLLAGLLEGDRLAMPPAGSPRRRGRCPGCGDGLEPARGVDEVARDHPLVRGADRDGRLAGQDAGPGLDRWAERPDGVDELESGPDGALGVVLVGGRGAPDRHDRVADELLDRAAVPAMTSRGERRSSGTGARGCPRRPCPRRAVVKPTRSANRIETRRRSAIGLRRRRPSRGPVRGPRGGRRGSRAARCAHSPQNLASASRAAPQDGQAIARRDRALLAELAPGGVLAAATRTDHERPRLCRVGAEPSPTQARAKRAARRPRGLRRDAGGALTIGKVYNTFTTTGSPNRPGV